jgi:hypothetical protein
VVVRDGADGESFGLAPAGTDPRDWLDALDAREGEHGKTAARSLFVPSREAWPPAHGVEQFVVVPLDPNGTGSLWLGFAEHNAPSPDDLVVYSLMGDQINLALHRLLREGTAGAAIDHRPKDVSLPDLVSLAAHELRTPLTPITMLLQALERKARSGQVDVEALVRTRRQVNRLAQMITDLLDLTRLREGRMTLGSSPLELGSVLTQAIAVFREADAKRHVEVTMTDGPIVIMADEQRLLQSIASLVQHVARVTPADSLVRVNLERRGESAALTIAADRRPPTADPDADAERTQLPEREPPPDLATLVARSIFSRFGATVATTSAHESRTSVSITFPLGLPRKS